MPEQPLAWVMGSARLAGPYTGGSAWLDLRIVLPHGPLGYDLWVWLVCPPPHCGVGSMGLWV